MRLQRIARLAGSVILGLGLLAVLLVVLAVTSLLEATKPAGPSMVEPASLYGRWWVWALVMAICANMSLATLTQIPLALPRLGAWLSHAGVVVLVVGGAWYAAGSVQGHCVSTAQGDAWTPITHFYREDQVALQVSQTGTPEFWQTSVPSMLTSSQAQEIAVQHGLKGVEIALLGMSADPTPMDVPCLEVQVRLGAWSTKVNVLFSQFIRTQISQRVMLPDGRQIQLSFTRFRQPLAESISVLDARYETHPASQVPRDYVCKLLIGGQEQREEILRLNSPVQIGKYQISQGFWYTTPSGPHEIMFSVGSKPGLPVAWCGCVMICVGLAYGFYVKPMFKKGGRA